MQTRTSWNTRASKHRCTPCVRRVAGALTLALVAALLCVPSATQTTEATWRLPEYANTTVTAAQLDFMRPTVKATFVPIGARTGDMTLTYVRNPAATAYFDPQEVEYSMGTAHKPLPVGASAWTKIAADGSLTTKFSMDFSPGTTLSGIVLSLRFTKPGGWVSPWLNVKGDYDIIILGHAFGVTTTISYTAVS